MVVVVFCSPAALPLPASETTQQSQQHQKKEGQTTKTTPRARQTRSRTDEITGQPRLREHNTSASNEEKDSTQMIASLLQKSYHPRNYNTQATPKRRDKRYRVTVFGQHHQRTPRRRTSSKADVIMAVQQKNKANHTRGSNLRMMANTNKPEASEICRTTHKRNTSCFIITTLHHIMDSHQPKQT